MGQPPSAAIDCCRRQSIAVDIYLRDKERLLENALLPIPDQPLKLALIGAGARSRDIYIEREKQRKQFGVDPLDVEAMLSVSFPRP